MWVQMSSSPYFIVPFSHLQRFLSPSVWTPLQPLFLLIFPPQFATECRSNQIFMSSIFTPSIYISSPLSSLPQFNIPVADQDLTVITDRLHPGGCIFNSGTRPVYKRTHPHQHSILSFQCKPFSYGSHGKYIDLISQDRENTAEVNMAREIIKPVFSRPRETKVLSQED